jgi:hypothetical protein
MNSIGGSAGMSAGGLLGGSSRRSSGFLCRLFPLGSGTGGDEIVTTPTLLPTGAAAAFLTAAHVVQVAAGAAVGDVAGAGDAYVATL